MAGSMLVRKTTDRKFSDLGKRIKKAREADQRSLTLICGTVGMTTANWYKIENEELKALPLETLRKIEQVLGVSFGVDIDD